MNYEKVPCTCGEGARVVYSGAGIYIHCVNCGRDTPMQTTKTDALRYWEEKGKEIMKNRGICNLALSQIYPHPDNPRKDLGDLSEMTESVKKNGIMQNLTVIPGHWDNARNWSEDGYTLVIGHRRHAAAKKAELDKVPCRIIEGMTYKEQVSMMLEENMQRNDLTIWEQAQGFQMMLDLGDTEEHIAEKTGFSKTTIRHRLNIAKLDQKLLREKEKSDSFQLTLTDLYALEQIEDVKTRDKVLKEAASSRELIWRAKNAVDNARRDKNAKQIIELLKAEGLQPAPKEAETQLYSGKWETMKSYNLDEAVPKRITKKRVEGGMYVRWYREIRVIKKKEKSKEPQTEWEKKQKQKKKDTKTIEAIAREMAAQREDFIRSIISGKITPLKNTELVMNKLWRAVIVANGCIGRTSLAKFLANTKKSWYDIPEEDKKKAMEELEGLSTLHQLMIGAFVTTQDLVYTDYDNHYKTETGKAVMAITEALNEYGFAYAEDEQNKVMEGSHECYVKEKENAE